MATTIDLRYDPELVARGMKRTADAMLETSRAADTLGKTAVASAKELGGISVAADGAARSVVALKGSVGDLWRQGREDLRKLRDEFEKTEARARKAASAFDPSFEGGFGMNRDQWRAATAKRDAINAAKGKVDPKGQALIGAGSSAVEGAVFDSTGSAMLSGAAGALLTKVSPEVTRLAGTFAKLSVAGASLYAIWTSVNSIMKDLADRNHTRSGIGRAWASNMPGWLGGGHGATLASEDADVRRWGSARQADRIRANPDDRSLEAMNQTAALRARRNEEAWDANLSMTVGSLKYSDQAKKALEDALKTQEKLALEGKLEGERAIRVEKEILELKRRQLELEEKEAYEAKQADAERLAALDRERQKHEEERQKQREFRDWIKARDAEAEAARQADWVQGRADEKLRAQGKVDAAMQANPEADPLAAIYGKIHPGELRKRTRQREQDYIKEAHAFNANAAKERTEARIKELNPFVMDQDEFAQKTARIRAEERQKEKRANRKAEKEIRGNRPEIEGEVKNEMAGELVTNAEKQGLLNSEQADALRGLLDAALDQSRKLDDAIRFMEELNDKIEALKGGGRRRAQQAGNN